MDCHESIFVLENVSTSRMVITNKLSPFRICSRTPETLNAINATLTTRAICIAYSDINALFDWLIRLPSLLTQVLLVW